MSDTTSKVAGIGRIFFRSKNPEEIRNFGNLILNYFMKSKLIKPHKKNLHGLAEVLAFCCPAKALEQIHITL